MKLWYNTDKKYDLWTSLLFRKERISIECFSGQKRVASHSIIKRNEGVMMNNWKRLMMIVLCVGLATVIIGCKKDESSNKGNDTSKKGASSAQTYPFTGLEADENVDNRPLAVMINNHNTARPHSGIVDADIVFEVLAEGDITRFLAIFQSEIPDTVGSVRSAREYYFELAQGYDAIYVYHGAANFVNDMINSRNIDHLNGAVYDNDQHLFKRDASRKAPHNSYVLLENAHEVAQEKGYVLTTDVTPFEFVDTDTTIEGEDAQTVEIGYNGQNPAHLVSFTYDEQSNNYARSEDGMETKDLITETPIKVENIFIIETEHRVFDSEGRREVNLTSGGNGYLVQQGVIQEVEWENKDGQLLPVKDGQVVPFVPGKTWVNIIPTDPGLQSSVRYIGNE